MNILPFSIERKKSNYFLSSIFGEDFFILIFQLKKNVSEKIFAKNEQTTVGR